MNRLTGGFFMPEIWRKKVKEYEVLKPRIIGDVSYAKGQKVKLKPIDAQTYLAQGVIANPALKKQPAKTAAKNTEVK